LLVTSSPAWHAVRDLLRGLKRITTILAMQTAIQSDWDSLLAGIEGEGLAAVYAVGGGLTADAGKYFAAKMGLPLTVIPTALSVDAFLTAASGIRQNGCVQYIDTKVPDTLILDLAVIAAAPPQVRAAGVTDVLSIATGCWDWAYAEQHRKNPPGMALQDWVYDNAQTILHGAMDCADAAGQGDREGLKTLYDCLAMEVQLCNQVGHARPEEGSEHYFAYCAENFTGPGWPHGDLVGPGIVMMAQCQGQETARLEAALRACAIPLDRIPQPVIQQVLAGLPGYCETHHLPFGIAHTLQFA
jgi:glycerol-1-phosphate dehydrogenase [NAD(P)+]